MNQTHPYKKLSIQVSLNGLSFYVEDSIWNKIILSDNLIFIQESTPYLILKELKKVLEKNNLINQQFEDVEIIYKNQLYCLVPKPLFTKEELPNYLKFNTKILANDEIVYDQLTHQEIVCVYIPYTNINNYLFDCFGEFEFKHHSTTLLQVIFHQKSNKTSCYVYVEPKTLEIVVMNQRKLLLYNQFHYKSKEDFLYYVLFTYEQLGLDVEQVKLKLFGMIEEGDEIFEICYKYLKKVVVFEPKNGLPHWSSKTMPSVDLTLLEKGNRV
ncbi:MAG: DUF3822 family protein [Croceivirga sp.]